MFYLINKTLHSISFATRLLVYWHALCWLQYGLQSDSLRWWHLTCRRNPVCEKRTNSCILNQYYNSQWKHHSKRHHTKITEISEDHVMTCYRVFRSLIFSPSYRPVPPSRAPPFAGLYRLPGLPLTPALNGFKTTAPSPIANTMPIEPVIGHIK